MLPTIALIINAVLLIAILIIGFRMARAASKYTYWVGDTPRQNKYKWLILKSLILIVVIGLITAPFLIFYVVFLLIGGLSGLEYALRYGQKNYTPWGPPLAPIKLIMVIGIVLMLLQAVAVFFKDLATARGEEL